MTKHQKRIADLQKLKNLYRKDFKDIITLGDTFDITRLPPMIADTVRLITAKTPTFSNVSALNTVNYALAHVICQARVMINDPVYARSPIGANYYALTFAKSGGGKALPNYERVLTPTGWSTMGDITVGSSVIGSDGKPTNVTGVFPQGNRKIYKITFIDGTTVDCDLEHLWTVKHRGRKGLTTITLKEMLKSPLTKKRFDKRYGTYQNEYTFGIPTVEACEYGHSDKLPLDPYLLGILLGDGGMADKTEAAVTFTNSSLAMVNELINRLPSGDTVSKPSFKQGAYHTRIKTNEWHKRSATSLALAQLGLMGHKSITKFIPKLYMNANLKTRKAVVQGLIDTDGYVINGRLNEYSTSSPQLAIDFEELARSIGMKIGKPRSRIPKYTHKGKTKLGELNYRIKERSIRSNFKSIVDIEPMVGTSAATCITVAANDKLFVTNGYNLTHNSSATNALVGTTGIFRPALDLVEQERNATEIIAAQEKALKALQKDEPTLTIDNLTESSYAEFLEPLTRTTTNAKSSRGGIAGTLTNLSKEEFGSLGITIDELGMTIQNSKMIGEVIELLTEIFDMSIAESPLYKTLELQEKSVEGVYTNLLAHTSPKIVFGNASVKAVVDMMFSSAFARRAWFTFSDEHEAAENDTVPTTLEEADTIDYTRRNTEIELSVSVSEKLTLSMLRLLDSHENRTYEFSEEASKLYRRYFAYCKTEGKLSEDSSLHQLEIEGRSWRIGKLCGVWASAIGEEDITVEILKSAIYFAEWNSRYLTKFHKLMHNEPFKLLSDVLKVDNSISLADALSEKLITKATPTAIAETLEAVNSHLAKSAVVTYDKDSKCFVYEKFILVEPIKPATLTEPATQGNFTMSYKLTPDMPKDKRKNHLESFDKFRDDLGYQNIINLLTKDGIYSTFKYKEGPSAADPKLVLSMKRNKDNIISSTNLIVIDVDYSPVSMEIVHEYIENYQHILSTTSDKSNDKKFRLLLPINILINGSDSKLYSYVVRRITTELLIEADKVSFNPAQVYFSYLDSIILTNQTGKLYDITSYMTEYAEGKSAKPTKQLHTERTPKARKAHIDKMFTNIDSIARSAIEAKQGEGSWQLAKLARWLIDEGATDKELIQAITYVNNDCWTNPMADNKLYRTVINPSIARKT